MTAYALGYPIVTGCHTAQRMDALATVGGFAAHEADDMLITINYRVAGWGGVYVPEIVALGLTPVDWDGYLTQQRRWARSVLDVKFRIYPHVARQLPPVERLTSLFQGLYYLHGLGIAVGLALLTYLLAAGSAPAVLSWRVLPYALLVFGSLQACEVFRQAFFLLPSERGLHWRAGLLRLAKWPVVLLALFEALRPRDWEYSTTRKIGGASESRLLVVPHVFVIATLGVALVIGTTTEHQIEPAVLATAAIIALLSLLLVLSGMRTWPHPYDSRLDHRPLQ
jgi:cellulose synthase (UDP-forming)